MAACLQSSRESVVIARLNAGRPQAATYALMTCSPSNQDQDRALYLGLGPVSRISNFRPIAGPHKVAIGDQIVKRFLNHRLASRYRFSDLRPRHWLWTLADEVEDFAHDVAYVRCVLRPHRRDPSALVHAQHGLLDLNPIAAECVKDSGALVSRQTHKGIDRPTQASTAERFGTIFAAVFARMVHEQDMC